jgi:hypothetical protein
MSDSLLGIDGSQKHKLGARHGRRAGCIAQTAHDLDFRHDGILRANLSANLAVRRAAGSSISR